MTVTQDATSGRYIPQSAAEWTTLLTGTGIGLPSFLYDCQEASGNALDQIGGTALTVSGGAGITYQSASTGWSSKGFRFTDGNTTAVFSGTTSIPSLSTNSVMRLAYVDLGTPGASRNIWLQGTSPFVFVQITAAGKLIVGNNAATATSTNTYSGPTLIGVMWDRTNSRIRGFTATAGGLVLETISPTFNSGPVGAKTTIGGGVTSVNGPYSFIYVADWYGSAAELTDPNIASLVNVMVNGPAVTSGSIASAPTATGAFAGAAKINASIASAPTATGAFTGTMSASGSIASAPTATGAFASGTGGLALSSITITGASLVGGQTGTFQAIGNYSDGSMTDLSKIAQWSAVNTKVMLPQGTGTYFAGVLGGTTAITATLGAVTGSLPVTVAQSIVVARSLNRLPIQFADDPNMQALVACYVFPIQQLENTITSIMTQRNVYQATGATLTLLGKIIGQPRITTVDADFQRYVAARVAVNKSEGTAAALLLVATLALNDSTQTVILLNEGTATVRMRILNPITDSLAAILSSLVTPAARAGVRLILQWSNASVANTFTFDAGPGFDVGNLASSSG